MNPFIGAIVISFIASLGTGLGGLLVIIHKPGNRSYSFLMGLTSGVMISLSFLELVNKAWEYKGLWTAMIGFGAGAFFMYVIDILVPHIRFGEVENPGEGMQKDLEGTPPSRGFRHRFGHIHMPVRNIDFKLFRTGLLLAIGITIHNLPEGFAVGSGYMDSPKFGILIAAAIMLHNIPEGMATALPMYESGVSRWSSFRIALISGFAEPIGAVLAAGLLNVFRGLVPFSLAFAGGVMMFITLDELVPAARQGGHQHHTALGIILGSLAVFLLAGLIGI
jgi:ZIP family zinc transporter